MTCIMAGNNNIRSYKGVGVTDVTVDETASLPSQKQDGMIGEMIFVDMEREHHGAASIKDTAT